MSEPTKVKLQYPIEVDGAKVKELTLRRPKAGDFERAGRNPVRATASLELLANLAGITPDQARELDGEDYIALSDVVNGFLPLRFRTSEP